MPSAGELLNPYIKIGGTLAEPRLMTDTSGALISGGAAAATGGLSIVGKSLWDRLSRSGDPCGDLAAEAKASLAGVKDEVDAQLVPLGRDADAGFVAAAR